MNKRKLDFVTELYSDELHKHGIVHLKGFKDRVILFNDKLEKLAKQCSVTQVQYLDVLNSNWRELYEFQEFDFYNYIIRDTNKIFFTDYLNNNDLMEDFILDFSQKRAKIFNWNKETSGYSIIMNGLKEPHLLTKGWDFWFNIAKNLLDNNIKMINDFKLKDKDE